MGARRPSSWWPAVLAVAVLVLFYLVALAAVGGLGYLGVRGLAAAVDGGRVRLLFLLGAVASLTGAVVIAVSVRPRLDRFEAPGPEVTAAEQPALFAALRKIAEAAGVALPAHVYLVEDVTAFVAERGGVLGLGARGVMALGLPLLRALTVGELRAVVAHELGHCAAGDTALSPWIYRTQRTMVGTVLDLEAFERHGASVHGLVGALFWVLRLPFTVLGRVYVRRTLVVTRAQEIAADRLAVEVAGAAAQIAALKKVRGAAIAHATYQRRELAPLVAQGVLPPVGEGFTRFLADPALAEHLAALVDDELRELAPDDLDSHPTPAERIAAAAAQGGPTVDADDRPAIALVDGPERYETEPMAARCERPLVRVGWDAVGPVWLADWRADVHAGRRELVRFTIATVPHTDDALYDLVLAANERRVPPGGPEAIRQWAVGALGAAIAVALIDAGYALTAEPGAPFRCVKDAVIVEPFVELAALLDGRTSLAAWRDRYAALGLADTPLATATS